MEDVKQKIYEKELNPELLKGLIELAAIEPSVDACLKPDTTEGLSNRLAAALLICVDNRNRVLKKIIDLRQIKL